MTALAPSPIQESSARHSPGPVAASVTPPTSSPTRGAGWLAVGAVVSKTCQTAVLLVFAAVLAPADFGIISLAAVLLNVVVVIADLGTSTALVPLRGDQQRAERAARTALTVAIALSSGLVLAVWVAAPGLASMLRIGADGAEVLRGIALCVPLSAMAGVSAELLRRALDFRRRVLPDILGNVIGAVVTVCALVLGLGAMSLVVGQLAQAIVILALFWTVGGRVRPGWSAVDARDLLGLGVGLAGSGLLTLVILNVDYALIAHRLGADEVGIYSMAFRLAYMPYVLVAMVVGGSLFAHLSQMRGAAVGRAVVDAMPGLQALVVPLYVGLLVLAPGLTLLGDQWAPAVPALRWLAVYGLGLSVLEVLLVALKAVGRTTDVMLVTAVHLALLIGLLLAYVDRGVTAVAITQAVAGVVTILVALGVVARRVRGVAALELARRHVPVVVGGVALAGTALTLQRVLPVAVDSAVGFVLIATTSLLAFLVVGVALDRENHSGLHRFLPWRATPRIFAAIGIGVLVSVVALAGAVLVVTAPTAALALVVLGTVIGAVAYRFEWAAALLMVTEPFGDLLRTVHPEAVKAVGILLFVAWALRVICGMRPTILRHPAGAALASLVVVLLASVVANGADLTVAADHTISYASYVMVVVALVDAVRAGHPTPEAAARRLVTSFLLACTGAGLIATVGFLATGGRAGGPLEDPNDLAFFLVAALPFTLLARGSRGGFLDTRSGARIAALACAAILVASIAATLSRGALLGLVAMLVVALVLGALRWSSVLGAACLSLLVVGLLWQSHHEVVDRSLAEKEHIAAANVDSRFTTWSMAADMTADKPFLGQGPGGFAAAVPDFVPADVGAVEQTVVHNMYLDTAAELGILGLLAFLALIGYAVRGALRARRLPARRPLADAVLVAFAGTLTAAFFLSEQFYLPVWLLVALGIALDTHLEGKP